MQAQCGAADDQRVSKGARKLPLARLRGVPEWQRQAMDNNYEWIGRGMCVSVRKK